MRLCGAWYSVCRGGVRERQIILSVSPAEEKCGEVICLSLRLTCYLTPRSKNWTGEIGEKRTCYLAGVYQPAKEIEKSKVPAALTRFLKEHPEVDRVVFHLDNDRTGRLATRAIRTVLPKKYQTRDEPPKQGNDCNDSLCIRLGIRQTKREKRHGGRDFER